MKYKMPEEKFCASNGEVQVKYKTLPLKSKKPDFLRDARIKEYIKNILKLRSSKKALDDLSTKINEVIAAILKEAATLAKEANRKTVMPEDITQAYDKHVGKEHLTWDETLKQILLQPPADLGKISKGINDYIGKDSG